MNKKQEGITGLVYTCHCGKEYYRNVEYTDAIFQHGNIIAMDRAICDDCVLKEKKAEWQEQNTKVKIRKVK